MREAAWPALRADLGLSYAAIGGLLAVPTLASGVLEPFLALVADSQRRRPIVVCGGVAFAAAILVVASASGFVVLLAGFLVLYPASGAFVSLSQATLMDLDPERRERNMARWVLAGSVGVVVGPLAIAATMHMGWGWRPLFVALAVASFLLALRARSSPQVRTAGARGLRESASRAWRALRNRQVLRWLVLLELTNLLGDVLTGFLAVYFVDVAHVSATAAAFAVIVWTVAGLAGDAALVPLLTRVSGLTYLRLSAVLAAAVYPALLLAPGVSAKLVLLAVLAILQAGWYAIPQGRLYGELHGNSGVALAVSNIAGLAAAIFPFLIGVLAERVGLGAALWWCSLAPIALLLGLPRNGSRDPASWDQGADQTRSPSTGASPGTRPDRETGW